MFSIVNHLNDVNCLTGDASRFEMQPGEEHNMAVAVFEQGRDARGLGGGVTCATPAVTRNFAASSVGPLYVRLFGNF